MKQILLLVSEFGIFFCLSCNQKMAAHTSEKESSETCKDSLVVYKSTVIPGIQQTDLDGNVLNKMTVNYKVFLFSRSFNIITDSIKIGNKKITGFNFTPVKETPIYWNSNNEKLLLVAKTNCAVYQALVNLKINDNPGEEEENQLTIFYFKNGFPCTLSVKEVKLLPQLITE